MRNDTHSYALLVSDRLKHDIIPLLKIPEADEMIGRPEDRSRCAEPPGDWLWSWVVLLRLGAARFRRS